MPSLVSPSAISAEHLAFALGSARRACSASIGRRQRRPPLGRAPSRRPHPTRRLEELVDVEHPVLQQVAEAAAASDELERVARLDMLGQQQHGRTRDPSRGSPSPRAGPRPRESGGMRTSVTARSGACSATTSSSVCASPTRPTTSWPASRAGRRAPRGRARSPRRSRSARQHRLDRGAGAAALSIRMSPPWPRLGRPDRPGRCLATALPRRCRRRAPRSPAGRPCGVSYIAARDAEACLTTFVSASQATKYAAASINTGSRSPSA